MSQRRLSRAEFLQLADVVVSRGGFIRCRVHGQSMRPAIADDDVVVLGPVGSDSLRPDDVVLARTPRGAKLHRVVDCGVDPGGPWLRLRGDTQVGAGQVVRPDDVVARVHHVERSLCKTAQVYFDHFTRRVPWLRPRLRAPIRPAVALASIGPPPPRA